MDKADNQQIHPALTTNFRRDIKVPSPVESSTTTSTILSDRSHHNKAELVQDNEYPSLKSRVNIMPGLDRLLPILDAFGNVGHSGHKEGGKASMPEA